MARLRVSHIGICVSDWRRSLRFYNDVLGFRYLHELEVSGEHASRLLQLDDVVFTATPARHFSGRSMSSAGGGPSLWAGWRIVGPEHRAYYSGDTSLFPELEDIGERLGPFDLTMIEAGAYDSTWTDVHLGPEQAVIAHQMVKGGVLLPVHWGMFDLALHGWTEPMERVLVAAEAAGVRVLSPRPGAMFEPSVATETTRWWPELPWQTVKGAPVWSSGMRGLILGP